MTSPLSLAIPPDLLDEIARRVANILEDRDTGTGHGTSPFLTTAEAAAYLRCGRQRVFDLTSQGRLRVHKDGSRSLYRREDLDAYLAGEVS
jgi:excisionase family DNA binding protein